MDWALAKERSWWHHPHSPTLDTRKKARERQTEEHLVSNGRRRDENPKLHLRYHLEADQEQTGVEDLRCCPSYHTSGRCGQLVSVTQKRFLLNPYFPITTTSLLLNSRWPKVSKEVFNTNKNPNVPWSLSPSWPTERFGCVLIVTDSEGALLLPLPKTKWHLLKKNNRSYAKLSGDFKLTLSFHSEAILFHKTKQTFFEKWRFKFKKTIFFFQERFEPRSHFKSRLSLIVRVNVVLNRTVVVDSDWRFDNLCGSHLQSQSELYHVSWWYYTLVIDLIGQLRRDFIGRLC